MPRFYNQFATICGEPFSHLLIVDSKGIFNLTVIVDNEVLERVKYHRWNYYGKTIKAHVPLAEFITGVKLNSWTALRFKNGDKLDYRKENLTHSKAGAPNPHASDVDLPPGIFKVGGKFVYSIPYGLDTFRFKSTSLSSALAVMVKTVVESNILTFSQLEELFIQAGWKLECLECYYLAYSVLKAERAHFNLVRDKMQAAIRWHKQFGREPVIHTPCPFDSESTEQFA